MSYMRLEQRLPAIDADAANPVAANCDFARRLASVAKKKP